MADEEDDVTDDEDGEEEEGGKKKAGLKKKLLFIGLPVLLVLLLGTAGALMFLGGDKKADAEHASAEEAQGKGEHGTSKGETHDAAAPVYYELPPIYANIIDDEGETSVLKLIVLLEVKDEETVQQIEPVLPRIVDRYQGFLRELRMEDVKGSAGYFRLKLELLRRVNLAIAPIQVDDLTIDTLLVN
jgi:flagellar protein FliL